MLRAWFYYYEILITVNTVLFLYYFIYSSIKSDPQLIKWVAVDGSIVFSILVTAAEWARGRLVRGQMFICFVLLSQLNNLTWEGIPVYPTNACCMTVIETQT